ncbi:MAG: hypothetical protein RL328_205 [Acidobacteriota bacterium]
MAFVSDLISYGGLVLQFAALILLLRGPVARYFPLFLYLMTVLGFSLGQMWVYSSAGTSSRLYFQLYWAGELLSDLLALVMIIQLTSRALEGNAMRAPLMRLLLVISGIALLVPFVLFASQPLTLRWNQSVAQLLNFGAALMNLALWTAIVASKNKDRQLMKVSAGLGLMVAAAALTLGVRQFTHQGDILRTIADYVYRLAQIAGPAIWCWAFRPAKKERADAPPAIATPSAG